tara:strand:- start:7756 stop:7920 length:165 start_codon:yes stop_codon:yes gene_type:complete
LGQDAFGIFSETKGFGHQVSLFSQNNNIVNFYLFSNLYKILSVFYADLPDRLTI